MTLRYFKRGTCGTSVGLKKRYKARKIGGVGLWDKIPTYTPIYIMCV